MLTCALTANFLKKKKRGMEKWKSCLNMTMILTHADPKSDE